MEFLACSGGDWIWARGLIMVFQIRRAGRAGEPGRFIVITTYPDNAEPAVIEACKPTVPIVIGCACFAGDAPLGKG